MFRNRIRIWTLLLAGIALSGCSFTGKTANYIPAGTDIISEEQVTIKASVPDDKGALQPHTEVTLPIGTISKYDPKYLAKITAPKASAP